MMNRRDLLLNEMNIAQWHLTKPQVLKGDAQIRLEKTVKLVVISEIDHQQSLFFQDLLRTLALKNQQYQWLNLEQAMRLHFEHDPIFLVLQSEDNQKAFAKKYQKSTAWHYQDWQELSRPQKKRRLWQQMQPFCHQMRDEA